MKRIVGVTLLVIGTMGLMYGRARHGGSTVRAAPEINPASAVSAVSLLSGALLVIRRKK